MNFELSDYLEQNVYYNKYLVTSFYDSTLACFRMSSTGGKCCYLQAFNSKDLMVNSPF